MSNQAAPGEPPSDVPAPAPAAPAHSRRHNVIGLSIIGIIIVAVGIFSYYVGRDDANKANVGDCMYQSGKDSIEIVECTDPKAKFKVVGRVENKSEVDANIDACDDFATATSVYWEGKQGKKGLVLCLTKVK